MKNPKNPDSLTNKSNTSVPYDQDLSIEYEGPKGGPMGPKGKGPKKGAQRKGTKGRDHIHWWISINEFIDGPSMSSLMDIHQ